MALLSSSGPQSSEDHATSTLDEIAAPDPIAVQYITVSPGNDEPFFHTETLTVTPAPEPEPEPVPVAPAEDPPIAQPDAVSSKEDAVASPAKVPEEVAVETVTEAPVAAPTADSVLHEILDPSGVPWAYDCSGVGPGIVALALWETDGTMHICVRNSITLSQAAHVATHELQHIYQYRVMSAQGMSLDAMEAHLATLYGADGMKKSGGNYPRLEIAADCGTLQVRGSLDSGSYVNQCSEVQSAVATAFREGRMP